MAVGILGDTKRIINSFRTGTIPPFDVFVFVVDNKNLSYLINFINKENITNVKIIDNPQAFLQLTTYLILEVNNRRVATKFIKEWAKSHHKGLLVFRQVYEYGLSEQIRKSFSYQKKEIEVVNLLQLSGTKRSDFLILGGNYLTPLSKDFRIMISGLNISLLIVDLDQSEMLFLLDKFYLMFMATYLIQIEQIATDLDMDVGVFKKALSQYFNMLDLSALQQNYNGYLNLLNSTAVIKKKSIFKLIKKITLNDQYWPVQQLKILLSKEIINKATIVGFSNMDILEQIIKLPIKQIALFGVDDNFSLYSSKIKTHKNPYKAAAATDVILILNHNTKIAALSLPRLEQLVGKKIIIDTVNMFEYQEMKALNWRYIARGRKSSI